MIRFTQGDIFTSEAAALVNPVNCVGVMGKGLALAFKRRFPAMFRAYAQACKAGLVQPGRVHVWHNDEDSKEPRFVINLPTKRHFRSKSRLEDVQAGLEDLARVLVDLEVPSVAVPALGAGLGGLAWDAVRPCIEAALGEVGGVDVIVYEPFERV